MTRINKLSNREWEIVKLLLQGKSNKLIAVSLGISKRTVEFHLTSIYAKYQVNSRVELILKLVEATGKYEIEKLGHSTVDNMEKSTENRGMFNSQMDWANSPISKRNKTMKNNLSMVLKNALTGFTPSAFLLMEILALWNGFATSINNGTWKTFINDSIFHPNFQIALWVELLLLTSGFILATLIFNPKYLSSTRWRSSMAGVGAVILLWLLSIFVQPASVLFIALASLCTGMMSVLFTLNKSPLKIDG